MTPPDEIERFTTLYNTNRPRVYAYAVSRGGRQLADEVVAETFLVAWRRFADVPPDPLPWLLVVARTVLREQYRAETRRRALDEELRGWAYQQQPQGGDVAEEVAERAAVVSAAARLSDDDLELVTLVSWHGLSPKEAARVVGCSTATYFVRLHRARKRLEQAMAAEHATWNTTPATGTPGTGTPPTGTTSAATLRPCPVVETPTRAKENIR